MNTSLAYDEMHLNGQVRIPQKLQLVENAKIVHQKHFSKFCMHFTAPTHFQ